MNKVKLAIIFGVMATLMLLLATAVVAQEEPPPPYAGMKNPFPWDDAGAQQAGKAQYQKSCAGCHGPTGGSIKTADFSAASFPAKLEAKPDLYFWLLSEGRMTSGMPPFKSSLSEEQRWQVISYLHTLNSSSAAAPPPPPRPVDAAEGSLLLSIPETVQPGHQVALSALLRDKEGKAVPGAEVAFYVEKDFFGSGFAEVGRAVTGDSGQATLFYTPRQAGELNVLSRYNGLESPGAKTLVQDAAAHYEVEVGLHLPAPGKEVVIGPESAIRPKDASSPMTAFRLPGGIVSWLWLFLITVAMVWLTYFRAVYQMFRIPGSGKGEEANTRLIPMVAFLFIAAMGTMLVLVVIGTGPFTHSHVLP
ncbi:MAG: c-type cytochrome [Chloroflexi bacterium]|nr:c-type cytochrome [Chloroflexota bacterium]